MILASALQFLISKHTNHWGQRLSLKAIISGEGSEAREARDLYFREFDVAMELANRREDGPRFEQHVSRMEEFGNSAGVAANEIAYRRQTLLYNLTRGRR